MRNTFVRCRRAWCSALAVASLGCGEVNSRAAADAASPPDAGDGSHDAAHAEVDAGLQWGPLEPVSIDFTGSVGTPNVASNGRTLYFATAGVGAIPADLYVATRDSDDQGFAAPVPVPAVNSEDGQSRWPEISKDGLELYFREGARLVVATRESAESNFEPPTDVGVEGWASTITADRRSLYYVHQVALPRGEVRRISRAAPGQPWSTPSTVALPVAVQTWASIDISEDELSMLIAPAWTGEGTAGEILIVRREDRSTPFTEVEVIGTMTDGLTYNSARWTAGDSQIWVGQNFAAAETPFVMRLR